MGFPVLSVTAEQVRADVESERFMIHVAPSNVI